MSAPVNGKAPEDLTPEELDALSHDELVQLGTNLDGVQIAYRRDRWTVKGTKAEKRAERQVAFWFILAGVAALLFLVVFLFWPHWQFVGPGGGWHELYVLYTPLLGLTLGLSIVSVGFGVIMLTKKFVPEEISIQERHDKSTELDRKTTAAELVDAMETSGVARRKVIQSSLIFGGGLLGIAAILPVFSLIKNPWAKGAQSPLWVSGWTPKNGEKIYLRRDTGRPEDVSLVRPEELSAGGMETVFPHRRSAEENEEELLEELRGIRNAVMLIRMRPADAVNVTARSGQSDFHWGDYFAYSKICTHLGCPTSLYEQQTNSVLCPCHQSQFDLMQNAKPIFGPAARALPQLPITVDEEGYLVAKGDFIEALGPGFWERRKK